LTLAPAKVGDRVKKNQREVLIQKSDSGLAALQIQKVVKGLQALRCITRISAVPLARKSDNISGKDRSCDRRFRGFIVITRGMLCNMNRMPHVGCQRSEYAITGLIVYLPPQGVSGRLLDLRRCGEL
jgi:hypothetical protein